jgi:hypothetical protein
LVELKDPYYMMVVIGMRSTLPDCQLAWSEEIDQQELFSIHSIAVGKKSMIFDIHGASTPLAVI